MFILDTGLKKEESDALVQEIESDISKGGKVEEVQRMGRRRMEHPIGRQVEGYYVLANFFAEPSTIKKLQAKYRLKETVLRFFFLARMDGFVKIKSFDENAYHPENHSYGYSGGYSQDAAPR